MAAIPLIVLYVVSRGLRNRRYFRNVGERFGRLPATFQRTTHDAIWFHAVSVGEVISSVELISRIRKGLPDSPIYVSCTTLAGRDVADQKLAPLVDGVFYAPFDFVFAVRAVLRRIRPAVLVVLETEIWPNLYREARKAGVRLLVVNGRISVKSLPGYRRFRWFFRETLSLPDRILVQSAGDAEHYCIAGAAPERVEVAGNLKYDFNPRSAVVPDAVRSFLERNRRGPIWIAASTVAPEYPGDVDEDDAVIDAWRELALEHPDLMLVLAPRRPDRFDAAAAKLNAAGVPFVRRSQLTPGAVARVLLLDTVGELSSLFAGAEVVFMGGTLAHRGGHNILEPALFGLPVIVGPHLENFAEIQEHFRAGDGLLEIASPDELRGAVDRLLRERGFARALGERARLLAEAERGATDRAVRAITELRWRYLPHSIPNGLFRPLLWLLAQTWTIGGVWKRRSAKARRLDTPVISIGGIAMGGVGKTPFVRYLAERLYERGYRPAILTRGYKRRSAESQTLLAAGEAAPVSRTGDEAQILLRSGVAPLGIAADRYAAGRALEERFRPDVFLLDDGFQHARLYRDIDIVLLDGLDPLAGGGVFPLAWLREPVEALRRADHIVITRSEGRRYDGLLAYLAAHNTTAPVSCASVAPRRWVEYQGGPVELAAIPGQPALAFCGLANPAAFWSTLRKLGIEPAAEVRYPDHHPYSESDMRSLADRARKAGTAVLLTTEKDAMNLPADLPKDVRVFWLEIGIELDGEQEFLQTLTSRIRLQGK